MRIRDDIGNWDGPLFQLQLLFVTSLLHLHGISRKHKLKADNPLRANVSGKVQLIVWYMVPESFCVSQAKS